MNSRLQKLESTKTCRPVLETLAVATVIVFCMVPGLLFTTKGLQSPWNASRVARAQLSLQSGQIVESAGSMTAYRAEHLGSSMRRACPPAPSRYFH
jgi:hypothetical protein